MAGLVSDFAVAFHRSILVETDRRGGMLIVVEPTKILLRGLNDCGFMCAICIFFQRTFGRKTPEEIEYLRRPSSVGTSDFSQAMNSCLIPHPPQAPKKSSSTVLGLARDIAIGRWMRYGR